MVVLMLCIVILRNNKSSIGIKIYHDKHGVVNALFLQLKGLELQTKGLTSNLAHHWGKLTPW